MKAHLLIAAFCFAVVGCTLVDAPTGPNQIPNTKIIGVGYYVSPNGSAVGDGSKTSPWDLQTALDQPGKVTAGDTIWMMGGVYKNSAHDFISKLTGTPDAPVVLRAYPGERATIDGRLDINGSYAYYWGFEVMDSDPNRVTTLPGPDPADLPRQNVTVFIIGPFNKVINLVVHDLGDGLFAGSAAEGLEIYGSLFYNNGWRGPDRGYGHNLYLQNQNATKRVLDNVLFSSFSSGFQIYGSDAAFLWNFDIEGNSIFNSGGPVPDLAAGNREEFQEEGASGRFGHTVFKQNSIYHSVGGGWGSAFRFNAAGEPPGQDIQFLDNIVQGTASFNEVTGYVVKGNKFTTGATPLSGQNVALGLRMPAGEPLAANVWDNNQYAAVIGDQNPFYYHGDGNVYTFAGWKAITGYDANSKYLNGTYSGADVIVRPNHYEAGRAFITCWNWDGASTLKVDLSSVLKPGDKYEIHHVYDVFGAPVVSGVYAGGSVAIPQTNYVPPTPIGFSQAQPSVGPHFNVFLVEKR